MPTNFRLRSTIGSAILLTALLAGCRDDPAPNPDARASKVPAKQDKPSADKPAPSSAVTAKPSAASEVKPSPATSSTALSASAIMIPSAAPEPPAASPEPILDCDKLLTLDDVFAACKVKVEFPKDQSTDDIGTENRCSRRFESKEAGLLTLIITRHSSDADAKERYYQDFKVDLSKPEPIEGAGDQSRYFEKKGVSGDPILTAEAVKNRFNVTLFNPKVTVGGQTVGPVCDSKALGKLLVKALEHVP